ncbi:type II secretion system protein GspL [Pseudomonas sp. NBRC 111124]|uniref:type II secretion system protein GspL n=1 Tax=Pseudomonas sp. NBRC 111124 TaxID=1661039 RepID=UPI0007621634|nr:type II secretion system protein GspL [Pseudomonas sp. NBRC 111124]
MSEVYLFLLAGAVVEDEGVWPVLVRTAQGHQYRSQLGNLPPELATAAVVLVLPMELAGCCVIGPIPGRRPSREALGYAAEEQLAAPLEALHLAFGPEDQEGRRRVWVIALACLHPLMSKLQHQGIDPMAVHVDADLLSGERACALWFEGRWLLRGSEGTCLALSAQAAQVMKQKYASMLWMAEAGSPGASDCDQQIASAVEIMVQGNAGAVDLRQGALRRRRMRPAWRGLASGVVLALLMLCLVDHVRAQWLVQQASRLHAENVRVLQRWAPEQPPGGDLATRIRLLEHRPTPATTVEQLALLSEQLVGVGNVVIERAESTPEQGWRVEVVAHGFDDLERLGARVPGMRMEQGRQADRGVRATLSWREAE